jgi:hypothetical protein
MRRRSVALGTALDCPANIWPCIRSSLEQWTQLCVDNRRVPVHAIPQPVDLVLFTDASEWGWGAVLCQGSQIRTAAGAWSNLEASRHINELETDAVGRAIRAFSPHLMGHGVRLMLDNTSAIAVLRKGHSPSYFLTSRFLEVHQLLRCLHVEFATLQYVPSASNLADALSRGRPFVFPAAPPVGSGGGDEMTSCTPIS